MTFKKNILVSLIITFLIGLIACGVILFGFLDIPPKLNFDETEFAKIAFSLKKVQYSPYTPLATGHSTLYFYVILLFFSLIGPSRLALRLPSALSGVFSATILFPLMKMIFQKNKYGVLVAGISVLAGITTRWFFTFSRFAYEASFLLLLEVLALLAIYKSTTSKRPELWYLVCGIFTGLAYNSYTPGRIFVLVPVTFIFFELFKKTLSKKQKFIRIFYFFIPYLLLILPLSIYFSQNTDTRIYQQFFITNEMLSVNTKLEFIWQNISKTFLMFFYRGDMNGIHNYPGKSALNPFIALWSFVGLITSLFQIKKRNHAVFLIYFFVSVIPTILTYPWENPNMLRTYTVIPSLIFFMGSSLAELLDRIKNNYYARLVLGVFISLTILSSSYELYTYYFFQVEVFKTVFVHGIDFEYFNTK